MVLILGLVAGCFGILGNYLGSKTFIQGGVKFTRPLILVVLTIFFIRVIWQLTTGQI